MQEVRLVIIEDNAAFIEIFKELCHLMGWPIVAIAQDLCSALHLCPELSTLSPTHILLDNRLPDEKRVENPVGEIIAQEIHRYAPDIPIIGISNQQQNYLDKWIPKDELAYKLEDLLNSPR